MVLLDLSAFARFILAGLVMSDIGLVIQGPVGGCTMGWLYEARGSGTDGVTGHVENKSNLLRRVRVHDVVVLRISSVYGRELRHQCGGCFVVVNAGPSSAVKTNCQARVNGHLEYMDKKRYVPE